MLSSSTPCTAIRKNVSSRPLKFEASLMRILCFSARYSLSADDLPMRSLHSKICVSLGHVVTHPIDSSSEATLLLSFISPSESILYSALCFIRYMAAADVRWPIGHGMRRRLILSASSSEVVIYPILSPGTANLLVIELIRMTFLNDGASSWDMVFFSVKAE